MADSAADAAGAELAVVQARLSAMKSTSATDHKDGSMAARSVAGEVLQATECAAGPSAADIALEYGHRVPIR